MNGHYPSSAIFAQGRPPVTAPQNPGASSHINRPPKPHNRATQLGLQRGRRGDAHSALESPTAKSPRLHTQTRAQRMLERKFIRSVVPAEGPLVLARRRLPVPPQPGIMGNSSFH